MGTFLVILFSVLAVSEGSRRRAASRRIIDGSNARLGEFPYQARLIAYFQNNATNVCGGSILSPNVVLTAAHCFPYPHERNYEIAAGFVNRNDPKQTSRLAGVAIHPNYNMDRLLADDIAVVSLETPFVFSFAVQPIALPEADSIPHGRAVVSGWGVTNSRLKTYPDILQKAIVPIIPHGKCVKIYRYFHEVPPDDSEICASAPGNKRTICVGDSGGPLAQNGVVIGIVSHGAGVCEMPQLPAVYTRVSDYIDFINMHTDLDNM